MRNKKTLLALLSIAVVFIALLGLSGCSEQHSHSFSAWETVVEPTCTAFGVQKRSCECGYTEHKSLNTLSHTPVADTAVVPTCTTAGKTEGSHCDVCKAVLVAQTEIAPVPHTFSAWETVVEPTCTAFGVQKRICKCGYTEYKTLAALQHTPVTDASVIPTCTTAGKTEGSHCDVCKAVLVAQTEIAPVPHTLSAWVTVVEPTCTAFGVQKRSCECGFTEYKTLAALQHTPVTDAAIAATCTTDGKTEGSHCGTCGTILTAQNTVCAFGHRCDNVTVLTEADCNLEGSKRFSCSNTGCSYYYDESYKKDEPSAPEIMEAAQEYVGMLNSYAPTDMLIKNSTAIVIAADGKILTTYAALDGTSYATFTLGETTYDIVEVLAYDEKNKLAVLKIDATDLPCAPICESEPVTGETVYTIGYALGLSFAINEGIVSNAHMADMENNIFIQHDAVLMQGYGGGPLLNRFGEVIGINFGIYEDEDFNVAIPITRLSELNYDHPISMEESYKNTFTDKEEIIEWIKTYATTVKGDGYYFEHVASQFGFALGCNEATGTIFVESAIPLENGCYAYIHIPLERILDREYEGTYKYQAVYTDNTSQSEIVGYFDPATYGDSSIPDSLLLTYDTFYGRYWDEQTVMNDCSYAVYETLGWLSYCLDTYFLDITLKDTFGFTAVSYERDDAALEKLNRFVEDNGTFKPDNGEYSYIISKESDEAILYYGISYRPAGEDTESVTVVTLYHYDAASDEVYAVTLTLNPQEAGNLIEMFSGVWVDTSLETINNAWGYIDANSFMDTSSITCYVFDGYEDYEDMFLKNYASLLAHLLNLTNSVMSSVEEGLSIRDLGFLFYFLP